MRERVRDQWVGTYRAASLLGCDPQTVNRIAEAAGVRRRHLPGQRFARFFVPDLERVARESTTGGVAAVAG